jgi:hypothetical protein
MHPTLGVPASPEIGGWQGCPQENRYLFPLYFFLFDCDMDHPNSAGLMPPIQLFERCLLVLDPEYMLQRDIYVDILRSMRQRIPSSRQDWVVEFRLCYLVARLF